MQRQQPDCEFLKQMIVESGSITLKYFKQSFKYHEKSDNQGIVTEADFNSENFIKTKIHNSYPEHNILAEESGLTQYSSVSSASNIPMWIIDPLDGTTNFSKGNPYYCISIAFGYYTNGRFKAEISAVYQPTNQLLFFAEKGKGAYLNGKQIFVSNLNNFHLACFTTGFSSNKGKNLSLLLKSIEAIQNKALGVRINGAAALDLAYTASGVFQGFYESPLSPWDTAAGSLLIREAGGKITNYKGEEFCPINDNNIIASNNYLFEELFNKIKEN